MSIEPRKENYARCFESVILPEFERQKRKWELIPNCKVWWDRLGFVDRLFIECDADEKRNWGISVQFIEADPEDERVECWFWGTFGHQMVGERKAWREFSEISSRFIAMHIGLADDSITQTRKSLRL